ncbi:MAG: GNAT family N-acetyltransferase, partial [Gemmatimonadota bacterium]|nr:GNAT family N-acetyltransferase [Gemmatimonadota bacterium]
RSYLDQANDLKQLAHLRRGRREDAPAIQLLYQAVAATPGGIARSPGEVTSDYVDGFVARSLQRGILIVAEVPGLSGLAAELHAYRSELSLFAHVLGDLTVAVHPEAQGQGIGRQLFTLLLEEVTRDHPDITRVELVTAESNARALHLYESVGFNREGRFEGRIRNSSGGVEADIPMAWYRR